MTDSITSNFLYSLIYSHIADTVISRVIANSYISFILQCFTRWAMHSRWNICLWSATKICITWHDACRKVVTPLIACHWSSLIGERPILLVNCFMILFMKTCLSKVLIPIWCVKCQSVGESWCQFFAVEAGSHGL